MATGQQTMALASLVEAVRNNQVGILVDDRGRLGDVVHGAARGLARERVDINPLLCNKIAVVEHLEGELAGGVQQAVDLARVDLKIAVPELA